MKRQTGLGTDEQLSTPSSGGGGGGAVTIADGADVTQGSESDLAYSGTGNSTVIAALKGLYNLLAGSLTAVVSGSVSVSNFPGTQPVSGTVTANLAPATSGGLSDYHVVSGASTNAANIKASAGQLYGTRIFNNAAYPVYVKFHNTAGSPTPGSGVVRTIGVQAGTQRDVTADNGIAFSTGIGITITKGIADSDATAIAASDCVVDVEYK